MQFIEDFVLHLFPRQVRERDLRVTYTFCLGGLAFTAFLVLVVTGALLVFWYQPVPDHAWESIARLDREVWSGHWLRSLHRLSSHALLVLAGLHVLRVVWSGAFRAPREMNWVLGAVLGMVTVFQAYTGYLLPMDQRGYWAAVTGLELLKTIPLAGPALADWLAPDGAGQAYSLLRFYVLHVFVQPMGVGSASLLHFWLIRKNRGVLPWL